MHLHYEINKRLSREHENIIALLKRVRNFLHSYSLDQQPDWTAPESAKLLSDLKCGLETETTNHFAIEERELFPLMESEGYGDLVEILLEDHKVIVDLVAQIKPVIVRALSGTGPLTQAEWRTFLTQGNALVTELTNHAEKEEAGFVPTLEEILDEMQDKKISQLYQLL